jgi:hypothetical protein
MEAPLLASAAQRSALALLQPLEASGVGDFASLALASLRADGGGGPKAHAAAARRLGCTGSEVEAAVAALAALFISAARAATPPPLLAQRAAALGFAAGPAAEALRAAYEAALPELRAALAAGAPPLGDAFTDLRWRLDVRVRPARCSCKRDCMPHRSACMASRLASCPTSRFPLLVTLSLASRAQTLSPPFACSLRAARRGRRLRPATCCSW